MIYLSIIKLMMFLGLDAYFIEITALYILLFVYFTANAERLIKKHTAIKAYKRYQK